MSGFWKQKKVLLTGGRGFLGRVVLRKLRKRGCESVFVFGSREYDLVKRDAIQQQIDNWHKQNGAATDAAAYRAFLEEIGYLVPEGPEFTIGTKNVDDEIAATRKALVWESEPLCRK